MKEWDGILKRYERMGSGGVNGWMLVGIGKRDIEW